MKTQPHDPPVIAVQVNMGHDFGHQVVIGVGRYLTEHPDWRVRIRQVSAQWSPNPKTEPVDGWMLAVRSLDQADAARAAGIAAVNVAGLVEGHGLPSVLGDDEAAGRMAAEHLLDRGFQRFAVLHAVWAHYARRRAEGFVRTLRSAGHACAVLSDQYNVDQPDQAKRSATLERMLQQMPLPCAMLTSNDWLAGEVINAADRVGVHVPEELAIVGIGNDIYFTELCQPQLTSVDGAAALRGYEGMALLRRLIAGEPPPEQPIVIPPTRLIDRRSTDALVGADEQVVAAMRFIREQAGRPIDVDQVLEAVTCSRRTLENRFADALGHSIHEAIWQAHLDVARRLLRETDLSMLEIALRSGFRSAAAFSTIFKRRTGQTPRAYRRHARRGR